MVGLNEEYWIYFKQILVGALVVSCVVLVCYYSWLLFLLLILPLLAVLQGIGSLFIPYKKGK